MNQLDDLSIDIILVLSLLDEARKEHDIERVKRLTTRVREMKRELRAKGGVQ